MAKKLYVGGLSYNTKSDALKELFEKAGTVETVDIIMDRMTNQSKGFGFVEMSTEEEAAKAIEMYDGQEIDGRKVTVNEARPREERPRNRGFNQGGGYGNDRQGGRF